MMYFNCSNYLLTLSLCVMSLIHASTSKVPALSSYIKNHSTEYKSTRKIEKKCAVTMEDQSDTILREMAQAILQELDYYRELKRRRKSFSIWRPKAELTSPQVRAYLQSTCDPLLQEMAKTVLEEVQYYKNQRSIWKYIIYIVILLCFAAFVFVITGLIIWEIAKPPKIKLKYPPL